MTRKNPHISLPIERLIPRVLGIAAKETAAWPEDIQELAVSLAGELFLVRYNPFIDPEDVRQSVEQQLGQAATTLTPEYLDILTRSHRRFLEAVRRGHGLQGGTARQGGRLPGRAGHPGRPAQPGGKLHRRHRPAHGAAAHGAGPARHRAGAAHRVPGRGDGLRPDSPGRRLRAHGRGRAGQAAHRGHEPVPAQGDRVRGPGRQDPLRPGRGHHPPGHPGRRRPRAWCSPWTRPPSPPPPSAATSPKTPAAPTPSSTAPPWTTFCPTPWSPPRADHRPSGAWTIPATRSCPTKPPCSRWWARTGAVMRQHQPARRRDPGQGPGQGRVQQVPGRPARRAEGRAWTASSPRPASSCTTSFSPLQGAGAGVLRPVHAQRHAHHPGRGGPARQDPLRGRPGEDLGPGGVQLQVRQGHRIPEEVRQVRGRPHKRAHPPARRRRPARPWTRPPWRTSWPSPRPTRAWTPSWPATRRRPRSSGRTATSSRPSPSAPPASRSTRTWSSPWG